MDTGYIVATFKRLSAIRESKLSALPANYGCIVF